MDLANSDVDVMFEMGDFNAVAVFEADGVVIAEVRGWFTEPTDSTTMYNVEIEAQKPKFEGPTSKLASIANKTRCAINNRPYTVEKQENTGLGIIVLSLKTTT